MTSRAVNKADCVSRLTEEMRSVLETELRLTREQQRDELINEDGRESYRLTRAYWNKSGPELWRIADEELDGPHGRIPLRIYYPLENESYASIVYMHGGGFVVGSIETHDGICRRLAAATKAAVISVDYRLAPEYRFPVPLDECEAVINALKQQQVGQRISPVHLSLAGDSAGAYIALATLLRIRDEGHDLKGFDSLLLFYGTFGLKDSITRRLYGGEWDGLQEETLEACTRAFVPAGEENNPYFNLFRANLTTKLPPVCLIACDPDPLLDDSRALHAVFHEHNTPSVLQVYSGVIHGFMQYGSHLPEADDAFRFAADFHQEHCRK